MHSSIFSGQVSHTRKTPVGHSFRYGVYMMYLDLDELDQVFRGRWFWSTKRWALARFRREHHMGDSKRLRFEQVVELAPGAPFHFDATMHKPDHFPAADNAWEPGARWQTMRWQGRPLGLKFENEGTTDTPAINFSIYSNEALPESYIDGLVKEIRWRFNLDSDISGFCRKYENDKALGPVIRKWRGMKPRAANSLYETLIIYIVLQNAAVRRSVQMLESLFNEYGNKISFDGKTLSVFWPPERIASSSEQELRDLKIGYRAKFILRLSQQFANNEIDEFALRKAGREEVHREMLKIYGIGPASVEYLLFEDFYCYDALDTIPPWEQKIMSRLLFDRESVPVEEIRAFFNKFRGWEKLVFHYIWEDVFWRRQHEHIDWLEKEIRL